MEDNDRGGGGRVEGFVHLQQLFGSGEGGRECRQLFECNVGWQSRVQGQHGRYDAVGQQAFWLNTKNNKKMTLVSDMNVSLCQITPSSNFVVLHLQTMKHTHEMSQVHSFSKQLPLWKRCIESLFVSAAKTHR